MSNTPADWINWDKVPENIDTIHLAGHGSNVPANQQYIVDVFVTRPQPWRVPDASTPKWSKCWVRDFVSNTWVPQYFLSLENNIKYPFATTVYSEWTYEDPDDIEDIDDIYAYCLLADDHEGPPPMDWEGEE